MGGSKDISQPFGGSFEGDSSARVRDVGIGDKRFVDFGVFTANVRQTGGGDLGGRV